MAVPALDNISIDEITSSTATAHMDVVYDALEFEEGEGPLALEDGSGYLELE